MTIDEVVFVLKASLPNTLTPLQELVLRSSWEGKTYTSIAIEAHYGEERVRKVASNLWQLLSDVWKEPISKSNFRTALEPRKLTRANHLLINDFNRAKSSISLEFPNGPVSLDSRFYIERPPIEELVNTEISEPGSVICIKAPKKMGKTSLILRILTQAVNQGFSTVSLDFQQADKEIFSNLDKFLRWFCANISRELGLEPKLNDYWDRDMGSKVSCSIYFQAYLLESLNSPLVLVLNEVDWVFEYPEIAGDFLPLLRSWYEQAKRVEIWEKLRLVLAYSTEILVPLNLNQSPFNIGLPIKLPTFTKEQVQDLAHRHGLNWTDTRNAQKLMAMIGGHPYLVRLALYHLISRGLERDLGQLLQQAPTESGIYNEYLRQYVLRLQENPRLKAAFYEVITADVPVRLEPIIAYKLQSMGLIYLEGDRAYPACELYRLYFRGQFNTNSDNDIRVELLERENQELRLRSSLDELTQLPTRRYFNTYLQTEWQHSLHKGTPLSLILCDIDYFRIYNRTYGDNAGDECLQQIANTINNCVKRIYAGDMSTVSSGVSSSAEIASLNRRHTSNSVCLSRYGSEEFAILAPIDAIAAVDMAENIRSEVKALAIKCDYPGMGGLPSTVLTVSLGVASIVPDIDSEPTTLITAAEQALYHAKRKGRDRVVVS
jgi:GGDEF domain-containing protein